MPPLAPRLPLHVRRASRRPRRSRALLSVAVALKGGAWRDAGLAKLAKELSKGGGARELWMAQPEEPSWQPPPHPRRTIMGRGSLSKRKSCVPQSRPGATIGISEKDLSEQSESTARTATAARSSRKREQKVAAVRAAGTRMIADHARAIVRHGDERAFPYFSSSSATASATCDAARC